MPYKDPEQKKKKNKEYRERNKDKLSEQDREYREANKEKLKEKSRKYRELNKEKIAKKKKEWYENNKEEKLNYMKEYQKRTKEERRKYLKNYQKNNKQRRNEYLKEYRKNPIVKINEAVSGGIRDSLKAKELRKTKSWELLVGYTIEDLTLHLESLFKEGMTWDNYGTYWHIDHIRPKSWFVFNSVEDQAFKDCWALSNLQPLEASINCSKGNRYEG